MASNDLGPHGEDRKCSLTTPSDLESGAARVVFVGLDFLRSAQCSAHQGDVSLSRGEDGFVGAGLVGVGPAACPVAVGLKTERCYGEN